MRICEVVGGMAGYKNGGRVYIFMFICSYSKLSFLSEYIGFLWIFD